MLVPIDNKLLCAALVAALAGSAAAQLRYDEGPQNLDVDGIEGWHVQAVELFAGYDKIRPHGPNVPQDGKKTAPPVAAAPKITPARREELARTRRRQWAQAKPEAKRVIAALRPALEPLVDQMKIHSETEPGLLTVSYGKRTSSPYLQVQFAIEDAGPRLVDVYLFAPARGEQPAMDNKTAWEAFAGATMEKVFRRKLKERPTIQAMSNGYYFSWIPRWKKRQLPERYWMKFAAIKYKSDWVMAATARATDQQTRLAGEKLDQYPIKFVMRQAAIQVVKNAVNWYPDEFDRESKVWANCQPVMTGAYDDQMVHLVYVDRPAIKERARRGEPVLSWHVRVVSHLNPLESVVGWVDPATGKLLHMGFRGPPKR